MRQGTAFPFIDVQFRFPYLPLDAFLVTGIEQYGDMGLNKKGLLLIVIFNLINDFKIGIFFFLVEKEVYTQV